MSDTQQPEASAQMQVFVKETSGKPAMHQLSPLALLAIGRVFDIGSSLHGEAYGEHNWRRPGVRYSMLYAAVMRHLLAWFGGENLDRSGESHLAHAAAGIIMMMDLENQVAKDPFSYRDVDDRFMEGR